MTNHEVRWLDACVRCSKKDLIVASDSKNKKNFYHRDVVFCNTCGLVGHIDKVRGVTVVCWDTEDI